MLSRWLIAVLTPLLIDEAQYRHNQEKTDTELAGFWRVGFWHHFDDFDSLRFDVNGLSLSNPSGTDATVFAVRSVITY